MLSIFAEEASVDLSASRPEHFLQHHLRECARQPTATEAARGALRGVAVGCHRSGQQDAALGEHQQAAPGPLVAHSAVRGACRVRVRGGGQHAAVVSRGPHHRAPPLAAVARRVSSAVRRHQEEGARRNRGPAGRRPRQRRASRPMDSEHRVRGVRPVGHLQRALLEAGRCLQRLPRQPVERY